MRSRTRPNCGESLREQVPATVVATFAMRVGFVALEFMSGLILARILKASSYGVYAFVMSCVGLLAVPAAAGFDRLLVREVSMLGARAEWGLMRGLVRYATTIVLIFSIVLASLFATAAVQLGARSSAELQSALLTGALLVPLIAYARMRQAILQGLGRIVLGQIPEMLAQPATVLLVTACTFLLAGFPRNGAQAVLIQVSGAAIACVIGLVALHRLLPRQVRESVAEYRSADWMRSAMPFVWLLGMNVVLMNIDTVMVGIFLSHQATGIYRTASQMSAFVAFPLTAANMVAAPVIAILYGRKDIQGLQTRVTHAARVALAGALPIAGVLIAFGKPILAMFGGEFTAGYRSLIILTLGYVINASMGVAGYVLIMTRFERAAAWSFTIAACVDVALNLLLIPLCGIEGAATATALSMMLLNALMVRAVGRTVRINVMAVARDNGREG